MAVADASAMLWQWTRDRADWWSECNLNRVVTPDSFFVKAWESPCSNSRAIVWAIMRFYATGTFR